MIQQRRRPSGSAATPSATSAPGERLRIDGRKSVGQNIEEGAALIVLGFEVQRGFEHTRR